MDQSRPDNKLAHLSDLVVLVVDDDDDCRELLAVLLESRKAKVVCASNAEEGLARISDTRPDVLVSDIAMPGEDGYSLVRRVRNLRPEQGGLTPAIAVTAFSQPQDQEEAIKAGFTAHLAKPVDLTLLCEQIRALGSARSAS